MTLPIENFVAAYPARYVVRLGRWRKPVVLRPLTIGGAIFLDAIGIDVCRKIREADAAAVAFVLSQDFEHLPNEELDVRLKAFSKLVKRHLQELCEAVDRSISDAFITYVKPAPPKNATPSFTPHGVGWALSYLEFMCSEYGWDWFWTRSMPLATVFALEVASRSRNQIDSGDSDYVERVYVKERFRNG